jgi:uncharacterized protein YjbI with pentapeptide repeats
MVSGMQFELISRSVSSWNEWRRKNPHSRPDFRGANFHVISLEGADLRDADFSDATFTGTSLHRADLRGANFRSSGPPKTVYIVSARGREKVDNYQGGAHLYGKELSETNLSEADISESSLQRANLERAVLYKANLARSDLLRANLSGADLRYANLRDATLMDAIMAPSIWQHDMTSGAITGTQGTTGVHISPVEIRGWEYESHVTTDLRGADLTGADLRNATLVEANLEGADLTGCKVYGISAWGLQMSGAIQRDLVITPPGEPAVTVDDLEVAQFVHLMLNNRNIRSVIETITSRAVLILGRFTPPQKLVLDALKDQLRNLGYLPIIFDFEGPAHRNLTETVSTLAHLAKFVIADITNASSIPQELMRIVPNLPSVPVQPLIQSSHQEYGMFRDFRDYPWVLPLYEYDNLTELRDALEERIIRPATTKADEISKRRLAR